MEASIGLDPEIGLPDEEPIAVAVTPLPDGSQPEDRDPVVTTAPAAAALEPGTMGLSAGGGISVQVFFMFLLFYHLLRLTSVS